MVLLIYGPAIATVRRMKDSVGCEMNHSSSQLSFRLMSTLNWRLLYRVFIKSLYNFENLSQWQMKRQISGNYYEMRRMYLSLFFFFLPRSIQFFYMGTISCTKHVMTVLDFLHDRYFPQMFLDVHSFLYRGIYMFLSP